MEIIEAPESVLEAERDILRAMSQGTAEQSVWAEGIELLAEYSFEDNVHQLVFDTLREISTGTPTIIRERLPACLTRKGFPAVDLEVFLQPHNLSAEQAIGLMRALLSKARHAT